MAAEEDRAMPLFAADPDSGELRLQEATLEQVLLSDQLRDSPVIPITITGAFRRGKSFLLNVLLRYLRSQSAGGGGDWLEDAPLTGFPWRGGRQAHTRDLQLWSRPLPVTLADGRTAHVLLVDSQGAFDNVSTPTESVVMRALAGLLSGVQVLNVSRQPQSDDLQQARLCAEYARLLASAAGAPHRTPRLVLLVRDWAFPAEEPYGADGGRHILGHWLAGGDIEDGGDGTDIDTAADWGLAAKELECFLLPHPDRLEEATAAEPLSETRLQQVHREAESEARQTLVSCPGVDHLSEAQTIRPLAAAIQEHWEWIRGLNSERLQLRAAQADSHNAALAEASSAAYESAMLAALPADGPSITDVRLNEAHAAAVRAALQHFDSGRDGAGPTAEQQRSALCGRLEGQLAGHRTRNAALRQQEAAAAAELTRQAVARAQTQYQQQMVAAGELAEPALRQAHQAAAAAAAATAGTAGQAQLSGWLAGQLEPRLQAARQREKQELERKQAEAQAQLQAAQASAICGPRHRGITIRIGKKKFSIR
ncbi:atlastin-3-like [Amphibalanus amphitrite]|uniref:atlastin-3-like n=1 Tax=Amphibalanus amphitrite TaxID=1232801 RepID=UPI001C90F87D|nr:atlastin-3-like [Amphibalanus amphitrite]